MIFFLACISSKQPPSPVIQEKAPSQEKLSKQESNREPAVPQKIPFIDITPSHSLPETFKKTWPPQEWTHAKAYTFNFVRYGPGNSNYIYKEDTWNKNTPVPFSINKEQAEYALKLVHQTAGDVETTKCTFPRHGIVYFNAQDEPIASINYCFSCEAVLVWPPYQSFEERLEKSSLKGTKVEGQEWIDPLYIQIYYVCSHWYGDRSSLSCASCIQIGSSKQLCQQKGAYEYRPFTVHKPR